MADIDDLFRSPNADAYEKEEIRTGPPLSYVGEKLRIALSQVHALCNVIDQGSNTLMDGKGPGDGTAHALELARTSDAAFYQALVAFLALYNSMGRLGEWEQQGQKVQALKALDRGSFDDWLDSIESEGSVTG